MKNKQTYHIPAVAFALLLALLPLAAMGQGSARVQMVEMYRRGTGLQSQPQVLQIADSLQAMARKAGDKEMELRGMVLSMRYWLHHASSRAEIDRAVDPYVGKCREYGFERELYEGVSTKATWLTNKGYYREALDYQDNMMDYARRHNHRYGILIGYVSLGNISRMRMDMARAIFYYQKALDYRRRYAPDFDPGQNLKRIAECYIIAGHFDNAVVTCDEGIKESSDDRRIGGLLGMKAFSLFMLRRDAEFRSNYAAYKTYTDSKPDLQPLIAQCLDVMNLIDKKNFDEADRRLAKVKHIGFWLYVDIALYIRKGEYLKALATMQKLNISLYGESKGSIAVECSRLSANVKNNLAELDRQRAENEYGILELVRKKLELKNAELELGGLRSEENIAKMTAENKRLDLNNQRLVAKQLTDSLANLQAKRNNDEQSLRARNKWLFSVLVAVLLLLVVEYFYYRHHKKMTEQLAHVNSQLKHTHSEMDVASARALESDRQKTEFIRNMSHEIRTPLNSIVGFTQLLTDPANSFSDEEGEYMKENINDSSAKLQHIISSILDLTALETGKYQMRSVPTSLNAICRAAIANTKKMIKEGVETSLITNLPDGFLVATDPQRLQQVVETLLSNAAKFTEKGFIHVACGRDQCTGHLTITVTDTGCGIPEDKREYIFALFTKGDPFLAGTGLGLYTASVITLRLGGEISLDSRYTGGSRFCVELPEQRRKKNRKPTVLPD